MPHTVAPLTDTKCEAAKPKAKFYKLADGGGLYLEHGVVVPVTSNAERLYPRGRR